MVSESQSDSEGESESQSESESRSESESESERESESESDSEGESLCESEYPGPRARLEHFLDFGAKLTECGESCQKWLHQRNLRFRSDFLKPGADLT